MVQRVVVSLRGGRRSSEEGKGNGFVWWKEFVHIRDGVGLEVGVGLRRVYGGGLVMKKIFFCTYRWLGDMALEDRFQRIPLIVYQVFKTLFNYL